MFLLCALAISVTNLGTLNCVEGVYEMRRWWRQVEHPSGLSEAAREFAAEHHSTFKILETQAKDRTFIHTEHTNVPDSTAPESDRSQEATELRASESEQRQISDGLLLLL